MTTFDELESLPEIEDEEYEYKLKLDSQDDKVEKWAKTLVGFANNNGGYLFVGIDDNKNLIGLSNKEVDAYKNLILKVINRHIFPHINVSFNTFLIEGKKYILSVYVNFSNEIVYYKTGDFNEKVYIRKDGATLPATVMEILTMGKRKFGVDNHLLNEQYEKKNFIRFNNLAKIYRLDKKEPSFELLISKEIIAPDGRITAGLKMFSDSYSMDDTLISCRIWNGYDKGIDEVLDKKEYKGSICYTFTEALNFIFRNSRSGFIKMKDGSRLDTVSYPEQALREALVNAIAHRDYSIQGTQIDIDIFKDRLEITSPGSWMLNKSPSEYDLSKIPSIRRNKIICNCFEVIGLMEKIGSGFKKIYNIYKSLEVKKPLLENNDDFFTITLYDLLSGEQRQESGLYYSKYDKSILSFCRGTARSREEIQKHINYASRSHFVSDILKPLLESGLLIKTSSAKSKNLKYITKEK